MKKLNSKSGCSVEVTLSVMGGTWKPIIIFKLMEGRRLRFMELSREIPSVTQRMLTLQLRELEADGIVERTVYAEVPPRVDYELTQLGRSLKPVLLAMREWGVAYTALLGRTQEDRPVKAEVGSELEMAGSSGT
ncbi:winged helix-turn-helix transcriptional regulator [Diaphorobacter aerolatus]|uniref:Helix-turn-helix transcriptional regulator n=1 Tax=Diaphorobacter aerolatus TaxID=1288495 RepID=A0A7H0GK94_9BURK|nr:helix-turn-helix domain-containing protein [Diaphorobacter aerolatus]QNP48710.1 helix-turn-helix transcriptional regulator [Diaphorobacter aerolatus]